MSYFLSNAGSARLYSVVLTGRSSRPPINERCGTFAMASLTPGLALRASWINFSCFWVSFGLLSPAPQQSAYHAIQRAWGIRDKPAHVVEAEQHEQNIWLVFCHHVSNQGNVLRNLTAPDCKVAGLKLDTFMVASRCTCRMSEHLLYRTTGANNLRGLVFGGISELSIGGWGSRGLSRSCVPV